MIPIRDNDNTWRASVSNGINNFRFFDIHSHLSFPDFDKDWDEVIKRTFDDGGGIIIVGTSAEDSAKAIEIASKYERGVYATVGLHPGSKEKFDYDYFLKLAKKEKVVAIGECGLDYYHNQANPKLKTEKEKESEKERQKEIFKQHIKLAMETDKPLMIHCRDAHEEVIEILSFYTNSKLRGNIHFFAGNWEQAQKYFELGFSISFTGAITFPPRGNQPATLQQRGRLVSPDEVIKNAPLDMIMAETDAPFVTPVPYRGQRNEPLYVKEVIKKIAEIRGISFEEAAKATTENAMRLFLRV